MRFRKPRIRTTQIALGMRCPLQFYFLKTVGPRPPSGAATTGSCFHRAMEINFLEKAKSGIDAPTGVCTDAFNERFKQLLLDTIWTDKDPNDMLNKGIGMVKKIKEDVTPPIDVANEDDVERTFIIDCGDFEIKGTADLKLPERQGVIDWKTGRNMWSAGKAEKEVQGFIYPLGVTPLDEELLPLTFSVVTYAGKTGNFEVQHTRDKAAWIIRNARWLLKMVERREPIFNPYHFMCSDKYCGWSGLCPVYS